MKLDSYRAIPATILLTLIIMPTICRLLNPLFTFVCSCPLSDENPYFVTYPYILLLCYTMFIILSFYIPLEKLKEKKRILITMKIFILSFILSLLLFRAVLMILLQLRTRIPLAQLFILLPCLTCLIMLLRKKLCCTKLRAKEQLKILLLSLYLVLPTILIHVIGIIYYAYLYLKIVIGIKEIDELVEYVLRLLRYGTIWSYDDYFAVCSRSSLVWNWILFGFGACGETAEIAKTLLAWRNLEAYVAGFPGENHVFAVVRINETWYVVDPGYYEMMMTLEERVKERIREFGNVSYIVLYQDDKFVELTKYYVPYDTIVIKVTYNGEPKPNVRIVLRHKFQGKELSIPDSKRCFYTNGSGIVVIHLGSTRYNNRAEPYEPYYWIYVNGTRTPYKVASTGSYKVHFIHIELTKLEEK